jgi:MoaA/NifB/PqqE/SkfB family radical SAM enzyme
MACRHCSDDVWGDAARDLTLDEIEKLSLSLGHVDTVALGGGEPFMRTDLADICRLFVTNNHARVINIPSNGFTPERIFTTTKKILAECPETPLGISLSLDGFQETHDLIRTPGSFARGMETGQLLHDLCSSQPKLSLTFNATISTLNRQELPELARFLRRKFQSELQFNIISGNPRDPSVTLPSRSELQQTIDEIYAARETAPVTAGFLNSYRDAVLGTIFDKGDMAVPCKAGSLLCLIDANGDVRSCPLLPPLGNLREKSFRDIWNSPDAMCQYTSIKRGACRCANDCFTGMSLLYYWKLPLFMARHMSTQGRRHTHDNKVTQSE